MNEVASGRSLRRVRRRRPRTARVKLVKSSSLRAIFLKSFPSKDGEKRNSGKRNSGENVAAAIKALDHCLCMATGDGRDRSKQARVDEIMAETCRSLATSHLQAMELDKASRVCKELLKIHERSREIFRSEEELCDRNLMAIIASAKGDHATALDNLRTAAASIGDEHHSLDLASIQACIGDTLTSLGRFKEADMAYHTALEIFAEIEDGSHAAVGSVCLSLADLRLKLGNAGAARMYCDRAAQIYEKSSERHSRDALVSGLAEAAEIYESLGEIDRAAALLRRALRAVEEEEEQEP